VKTQQVVKLIRRGDEKATRRTPFGRAPRCG
jgi:hypothetical protein